MHQDKRWRWVSLFGWLGLVLFSLPCGGQAAPERAHPRLFLSAGQLTDFKRHVAEDSLFAGLDERLVAVADAVLPLPPEDRRMIGRRLLTSSRKVLKRILHLGYAYRMTGDRRYFERAREELLHVAAYPDFNPAHFLDVAEMATALAIGYDWFYDVLSETDRTTLARAVHEKAFRPGLDDPGWWVTTTNNWNQVCNGGLGVAAIAFYEEFPGAADSLIRRAQTYLPLAYEQYAPDGAYAEGASYFEYGTSFHALFLDAVQMNFPGDNLPEVPDYFLNSGNFLVQIRGPEGYYNYGDSRDTEGLSTSIFFLAGAASAPGSLYYQYPLLEQIAAGEKELFATGTGNRLLPLAPIWLARTNLSQIGTPPAMTSFTSSGMNPISVYRTSFSDTATFVAMKGGTPSMNHGHMDIGSFVLDAMGERWVRDPGMHDYEALESQGLQIFDRSQDGDRWKVNRYTNFAHSTLTVNNNHQHVSGFATLQRLDLTDGWRGSRINMDSVYLPDLEKASRILALHQSGAVVVTDELRSPLDTAATVRWNLLVGDQVVIMNDNTAVLHQGERKLMVRVLSPTDVRLHTSSSQPSLPFERELPGTILLGFTTTLPADQAIRISVLLTEAGKVTESSNLARSLLNKLPPE
ncbi:MAG: heparinase II/III family protein [Lewinella sp.]